MNNKSTEELEKSANKRVRELLLQRQKYTSRNLFEKQIVDKQKVQEAIGKLIDIYAQLEKIQNAEIVFHITNGRFDPYNVLLKHGTGALRIVRP